MNIDFEGMVTSVIAGAGFGIEIPEDLLPYDEFQKRLPATMRKIGREAKSFWKSEAGRRLKSSRIKYQDAIDFYQEENTLEVYIGTDFAASIETGFPEFDQAPKLLAGADNPRIKIPKAVADARPKVPRATKWRIVPLNTNHSINGRPIAYRTITNTQPSSMWQHPGYKGANIMPEVERQLVEVIIPKHLGSLIDSVFAKQL